MILPTRILRAAEQWQRRQACQTCGERNAPFVCAWPCDVLRPGVCGAHCCEAHVREVAEARHYCRAHWRGLDGGA